MSDTFDWRIIDRHLAGESSPADQKALRRWLAEDPSHVELLSALREAAQSSHDASTEHWNVEAAWSRVSPRRASKPDGRPLELSVTPRAARKATGGRGKWRIAGAAAALAAAVFVAMLWGPLEPTALVTHSVMATHEVVAPNGQQTHVTLHDGTRVVLNAGSRLRYATDLGRDSREVWLDGEGYFDVAHDKSRPFRVHARDNVAEDMGTRFVVRAYRGSRHIEVVVEQGRVSLRRDRASAPVVELGPGQLGRVEDDWSVTIANEADMERWLSWTHGVLALEGMTLGEAATEIGRRFDARIVLKDSALARRHVSAHFRNESLASVLDALTRSVGARWTRDGQRVVITIAQR